MTTPNPPQPPLPVINASELGEFAYCERAWWLRHVRKVSPVRAGRLAAGRAVHQKHFDTVQAAIRWRRLAAGLMLAGALLVLLAIALGWG